MSYTYLQEQGEESSADYYWDIPLSVRSNWNDTREVCCCSDNEMESCHLSRYGTTFAPSTEPPGEDESIVCAVDSLAKTLAPQEKAPDWLEQDPVYGLKWRESSARFDRDTSLWKIHPCLFPEDSMSCSVTLPRWGMMRCGELSVLTMPARLTSATGSGFWHTPTTMDSLNPRSEEALKRQHQNNRKGRTEHSTLREQVVYPRPAEMWPAPTKRDYKGRRGEEDQARKGNPQDTLPESVAQRPAVSADTNLIKNCSESMAAHLALPYWKRWPTPTVNDSKNATLPPSQIKHDNIPGELLRRGEKPGGRLNPTWVAWLMGWPIGWTDSKPLATDRFQQWRLSHGEYLEGQ